MKNLSQENLFIITLCILLAAGLIFLLFSPDYRISEIVTSNSSYYTGVK